ncbi:MAG: isocitrate/isopropylmalate family dehydrogenase, partial [Myxococcota bacterium]|nr:isocitrate/isopropylmalate family dehydrogenase [Myxococcota bacterium]
MSDTKLHAVTLVPGDWIGPEVAAVTQRVLAALGVRIDWRTFECRGDEIPAGLLASARETGVVLKGKVGAQREEGRLPATVALRKELETWATVRAVRALPGGVARYPATDIVVIRETSEDIYSGMEHEITEGVYEAVKVTTQMACERIARFAFEYARANGRKRITIVHKSNIMKKSDGLFLRTAQAVSRDYPDIGCDEVIVDALCMRLVRNPNQFDVLLCGNLFGDIVSDLASGLAGGIVAGAS